MFAVTAGAGMGGVLADLRLALLLAHRLRSPGVVHLFFPLLPHQYAWLKLILAIPNLSYTPPNPMLTCYRGIACRMLIGIAIR